MAGLSRPKYGVASARLCPGQSTSAAKPFLHHDSMRGTGRRQPWRVCGRV